MKESWDSRIPVQEIFSVTLSAVGRLSVARQGSKGFGEKREQHNSEEARCGGGRGMGYMEQKEIQARLFPQVNLG